MGQSNTTQLKSIDEAEEQIYQKRKDVKYDTRDLTVELIVKKYISSLDSSEYSSQIETDERYNKIYVPEYQRDFTWDQNRQSKFIESIILGLPIPFIFVAENKDSSWEIVDGSQRIRTLHSFINNDLTLSNLTSLDKLNGYSFENIDKSRRGKILNTALRLIVLSEETTDDVKKDMFERINLGSDILKPMEKRKGIYPGKFSDFIYEYCKNNADFKNLVRVDKWLEKRQEREELLLRFFAISENNIYEKGLTGGISSYLDHYLEQKNTEISKMDEASQQAEIFKLSEKINTTVDFVKNVFPFGFRHAQNPQTKRSVFEAISIGTWLFLQNNKHTNFDKFDKELIEESLRKKQFTQFTHVANELHQKTKLSGRINYIKNMLQQMNT